MVLITLKLVVVIKKSLNFLTLKFLFFFCLIVTKPYLDWSHIFSGELQVIFWFPFYLTLC